MVRLQTPFQYMDGSRIDLFLGQTSDLFQKFYITDLGQTVATLLDVQIKLSATKKRKDMVKEICESLDVLQEQGEFKIFLEAEKLQEDLSSAMVRLAQACIRVTDLVFHQRNRTFTLFKEELEEAFTSANLNYETSVKLESRYGSQIELDFQITGKRILTLIQTLSTASSAASHPLSNEVFRKWYDLENVKPRYQFLTVYDSNTDVFRSDDIARIEGVSSVFGFPAQEEQFLEAIAA
jgi:hypothetical protein